MAENRCTGTTKKGTPCKAPPLRDQDTCLAHAPEETRESAGFGGPQDGAGRPRLPRPHERMREWVEEHVETVLAPYVAAIQDAVLVDKVEGMSVVTDIADLEARMRAADRLLDRVYGRPKQATELSGPDGGPVEVAQEIDVDIADPESRELLGELLRRAARPRAQ